MTKPNADKDVEKLNHSYIAGGDKKLYSYSVKTTWQFLIKLKIELPYTPQLYSREPFQENENYVHINNST